MKAKTSTFSASYILRRDKAIGIEAPLFLKIIVNGKKSWISLKRKIPLDKWDDTKKWIGPAAEVKEFNRYLDKLLDKVHSVYDNLALEKKPISAEIIKNIILGLDKEEEMTLSSLIKYHNEQLGISLAQGTIKHYYTTKRYLMKFLNVKRKVSDIDLSQINYRFIVDFEMFLRSWKPADHQRAINNNGVMKHLTRFRKMINLAIRMEWMKDNPFKNYKMKFQPSNREYLTEKELKAIQEKEFEIDRLEMVRDIFVFCCYTGLAYVDVHGLRNEHLIHGIDGSKWISVKRQKTQNAFKVPLLPKAIEIIEKYKDHPRQKYDQVLPVFSNQKTNSYLKEIADLCGVEKYLTFHLARHTFATTVTLSNGVPIESVSKMLGHTKIATTQIYAKVVEKKLSEDMNALRDKLNRKSQDPDQDLSKSS